MPPAGDQVDDEAALAAGYGQQIEPDGGIACWVVDCPGCGAAVLSLDGAPIAGCAAHGDTTAAHEPVRTGPDDAESDRSAPEADRSDLSPDVDGHPDGATVAALVAGAERPHATRADIRDAALTLLADGARPGQVAAALGEDVGQVRAWWLHARAGGGGL